MNRRSLNSNVWKIHLIKGLRSFILSIPIIVLFFQENGLSMKQVFLLQSLFSIAIVILEIPTGYFSDTFGRKISILMGGIFSTVGFAIYAQACGFFGFLFAELFLGLGASFISGSDSALLYDTLLEKKSMADYKKIEGRNFGIGMFSESVSSISGGFLALVSLRFPLYLDAFFAFLVIPIALLLIEPKRSRIKMAENSLKSMARLIKFSLHDHKEVKWLIIYSAIVSASTLTMFWFIQPFLLAHEIPITFFGIVLAAFLLFASFFSWNAHRIEKILGRKNSLIFLIALPVAGYFLLSSFWFVWSGISILLFYAARGVTNPVILDYINGLVSSDMRATILSVKNLTSRLMFAFIGPVSGWVNDVYSLRAAILFSGITFLILGSVSLAFMNRHKTL